MEYKISIIIPVYNAGKYLKKGLQSIINQTIGFDCLQVIMVDDASSDNSKSVIESFVAKYPNNMIGIYRERRSGVAGRPRNMGVEAANGKYLMFMDADDFFELDACAKMYEEIEELDLDMITANYIQTDERGKKWDHPVFDQKKYQSFMFTPKDYTKSLFVMNSSVCNKIFRTSFIKENDIKFLVGVPAEDAYFSHSVMLKTNKIAYLSSIIYNYRERWSGDLSISWHCSYKYFKRINEAYKRIYELYSEAKRLDLYRYFYAKHQTYMLYKLVDSTLMTDAEKIATLKAMKWYFSLGTKLEIKQYQKTTEYLFEKIANEEFEAALEIMKVVAENRQYIPRDIKLAMTKPMIKYEEGVFEIDPVSDLINISKVKTHYKNIKAAIAKPLIKYKESVYE